MKTKTMKITGILLTLVMLVMALGAFSLTASAADPTLTTDQYDVTGDGVKDSVYEIRTVADLQWFCNKIYKNTADLNAILLNDLDLSTVCSETLGSWNAVTAAYLGVFDGNGHTIKNLYINVEDDYQGLFGSLYRGTIKNLTVTGSINATARAAGFVGSGPCNIINCVNYVNVTVSERLGAGFIGYQSTCVVDGCVNYGNITHTGSNTATIGGIVGQYYGTVRNCTNFGTISSANGMVVAGIAGDGYPSDTLVENCVNYGVISADRGTAVEITYDGAEVKNCYYSASAANTGVYEYADATVTNVVALSETKLSDGSLAYDLGEGWGQEIGVDAAPIPGGKKVYRHLNGDVLCTGTSAATYVYSNSETYSGGTIVHDHTLGAEAFTNGVCDNCGYECTHSSPGTYSNATQTTHDVTYSCCNKLVVGEAHTFGTSITCVCGEPAPVSLTTAGATPTVSYYANLADAIMATKTNSGAKVTLLRDITLSAPITVNDADSNVTFQFTLDLNGKTLYNPTGGVFVISSQYGSLVKMTLTDSSSAKSGRIVGSGSVIKISARGNLKIDTVTLATGTIDAGGNLVPTTIGYTVETVDGTNSWNDNVTVEISSGNFIGKIEATSGDVTGGSFTSIYSGNFANDYFAYDENGNLVTYLSDTTVDNVTVKYGADLAYMNVTIPSTHTYLGKPYTVDPSVKLANQYLVEGEDYTISYANNDKVGTATITFTGKGAFYGTYTKEVEIVKGNLVIKEGPSATHEYGDDHSKHPISGKVVVKNNEAMEIPGTWTWVSGTTKATFTPDAAYVDLFNALGEKDVTVTVTATTPTLTITSPSPAMMPGQSIQMGVEVKNPHNASLTDLPTNFTLSYQIGEGGSATVVNGTGFTLPSATVIGSTVYVTIKSDAVSGKYAGGTSNTVEIKVGAVDYSKDINDLQTQLDELDNTYAADAEVQSKIDAIQSQIDQLDSTYATDADITGIQNQIDDLNTTLATKAELDAAKNALQNAIDGKADSATLAAEIVNLNNAIEAAKTFATDKDTALKAAIEAADGVLMKAIDQVQKNLDDAKTSLQAAIDTKADAATLATEVSKLNAAIDAAKTFATDKDTELKAAIEAADGVLMKAIDQVQKNLDDAKDNLQAAIDTKADAATLATEVSKLNDAIVDAKRFAATRDAELKASIEAADGVLMKAIDQVQKNLDDAQAALDQAIKDGDAALDEKITDLDEALEAAEVALKAADDANVAALTVKIENADASLDKAIKAVQKNLDDAKAALDKAIADGDTALNLQVEALNEALTTAKEALAATDAADKAELTAKIDEANASLQTAVQTLTNELNGVKQTLEEKDRELQTFITVVCVISGVALAGSGTFVTWFFIDKKKKF